MSDCNISTLMQQAGCFSAYTPETQSILKLALLRAILLAVDPTAQVDPDTLLRNGKCFACLTPRQKQAMKAQLYCKIYAG